MKYSIIILFIFILILVLINIYFLKLNKINKKGGTGITALLIQSNIETKNIEKNINKLLKNKLSFSEDDIIIYSETDKIKKFIIENEVTKFVTKKDKKEYSLEELLKLLKKGNLPQGTIYTTSKNNTYIYL